VSKLAISIFKKIAGAQLWIPRMDMAQRMDKDMDTVKIGVQSLTFWKNKLLTIERNTVGAQSITRFLKKNVFLLRYISGHRQDRELWFFFV
jgi:hypothetical protein